MTRMTMLACSAWMIAMLPSCRQEGARCNIASPYFPDTLGVVYVYSDKEFPQGKDRLKTARVPQDEESHYEWALKIARVPQDQESFYKDGLSYVGSRWTELQVHQTHGRLLIFSGSLNSLLWGIPSDVAPGRRWRGRVYACNGFSVSEKEYTAVVDRVDVPAGSFDALRIDGGEDSLWLVRGIGIVKWIRMGRMERQVRELVSVEKG